MSARGRGGRFMHSRREEIYDDDDPCGDDLESFVSGSDTNKRRDRSAQSVRLHVSNIPFTMSEVTLRQVFSDFGNPTIFLNTSHQGNKSKYWGFVDYDSAYEAQNAVTSLHKKPPHFLFLKWVTDIEENSDLDEFKKEILPCKEREPVRGKGRGAHVPLLGRAPNSYRSKKPSYENFNNTPNEECDYSNTKFRHEAVPPHISDTNDVYGRQTKIIQGNKSVVMGRGIYKNDKVEDYAIPKISRKVEEKIDTYMYNVICQPTKEQIRSYQSDPLPFTTGNCPNCDRPSSYICCNCKQWYCSSDCVREHLEKYGTGCPRGKMIFDESPSHEDADDEYLLDKKYFENGQSSANKSNNRLEDRIDRQQIRIDNEHSETRENKKFSGKNDRGSSGFEPRVPNQRGEGGNRGGNQKNSRNSGSRGSSSFTDFDDDNLQVNKKPTGQSKKISGGYDRPNRSGGNMNGNIKSGGNQGNKTQGNQNRQDRRWFGSNRNSHHENEVYVRNDDINATVSGISRLSLDHCDNKDNAEGSTVRTPSDEPEEVVVSSATNEENVYWVQMMSSLQDLLEMLKSIRSLSKSSKSVQPTVNSVYAALYKDEWYRAKILRVAEQSASVRFIDYGNEADVNLTDLKLIPKELVTKPSLALKIRIQGHPVKLEENEEITIKIINKDSSGAWEVVLVGTNNEIISAEEEVSISFDHFDLVHIMDGTDGEYYVQLDCNVLKLGQMCKTLGKSASIKVEPVLGELYVKSYCETWCRAMVVKERPLTVFYIDYGNSEVVDKKDLHPVPSEYKNMPGMAIKIKLAEGTSEGYYKMKFSESLHVKAVDKLEDGTIVVHVKGEKYPRLSNIDNSPYPKGVYSDKERQAKNILGLTKTGDSGVWISVQKIMSCEYLTGFLVLNTNSRDYCSTSDLSTVLSHIKPSNKYEPNVKDLVIARVGKTWCRGYVMLITKEEISVALIDYGKVVSLQVKDLISLPASYQTFPVRQAVGVVLKTHLNSVSGMVGEKIHLTNVLKVNDILKCTFGEYGEADILPWTPLIEEAGLRVFPLKNDSQVVISAFHTPKSIYLRSAIKEDARRFSELLEDISSYSLKAEPLKRKPLCGELVCAKYKEDGKYYRAQIFQKAEDLESYKVNFVDFGNTEIVALEEMQPLPDTFKKVPCFAIKVGLKDLIAHIFNPAAMSYLNKLTLSETVLLLTYDDSLGEVTLSEQDGKVINTELMDLMEYSLKTLEMPSSEHIKKLHPFMGQDVAYEKWQVYSRMQIAVSQVDNHKTVMALNNSSQLMNHLCRFLTPKINKYCEGHSLKSYNPRSNEMILAKYRDDDGEVAWYRAVCLKAMVSSALVFFIDYGNCGELPHSDIRCMPAEFMDTPAAVKRCSLYGITDSLSNEVKIKIKRFMSVFQGEAIIIEDNEDGNSTLWIPSLYPELEKLGHPHVEPPPGV